MKKSVLICFFSFLVFVCVSQAQESKSKNLRKRNMHIVNNELIEYQKNGLINWTSGYLQGTGKMPVNVPNYEDAAMLLAVSNLRALYADIQIIDTIKLSILAEQSVVCREIYRIMNTSGRGESISPVEIVNDTCVIHASIDFETLLNFQYQDTTLKEWILANYIQPKGKENEEKEISKDKEKDIEFKDSDILPYRELQKQVDLLLQNQDINKKNVDSLTLMITNKKGEALPVDDLNPSILSSKKIYVRLNGKLYDTNSNIDVDNLVPQKYQPFVNLGLSEVNKKIKDNTDLPKFLKAELQSDGSLIVDFDKLIEKKEKAKKIWSFVSSTITTIAAFF